MRLCLLGHTATNRPFETAGHSIKQDEQSDLLPFLLLNTQVTMCVLRIFLVKLIFYHGYFSCYLIELGGKGQLFILLLVHSLLDLQTAIHTI